MKEPFSIRRRLYYLIGVVIVLSAIIMAAVLLLLQGYNNRYGSLLHNVTTASEFNQEFKDSIDRKMYYYVVESRYSEGLPLDEVASAQELARDLLHSTTRRDSYQAISSVLDLCISLEAKINEIQYTEDFDERMTMLENDVYVLTSLIQEYMYSYMYSEAANINQLQQTVQVQIRTEILLVAVFTGALVVGALYYSFQLSARISRPLDALCKRAAAVSRGDLTVCEPIQSDTYEVRTLSVAMEDMIARLNEQIQEIGSKQESLRRTELALLQAQINPHFLYNTMDTIIWLMEAEKVQEAEEMVANLSAFFRHSLSRGEDVITLAEEERHVRSYLQIQQVRYKDILSYTVDIDSALHSVMIPKLTLQPLVENALYHGIKLKRSGGTIRITGAREGNLAVLQVTDDGIGMTEARLEELRSSIEDTQRVGFGFSAVNQRLQLQFGPEYGLQIESTEGHGTCVTIRIPISEEVTQ